MLLFALFLASPLAQAITDARLACEIPRLKAGLITVCSYTGGAGSPATCNCAGTTSVFRTDAQVHQSFLTLFSGVYGNAPTAFQALSPADKSRFINVYVNSCSTYSYSGPQATAVLGQQVRCPPFSYSKNQERQRGNRVSRICAGVVPRRIDDLKELVGEDFSCGSSHTAAQRSCVSLFGGDGSFGNQALLALLQTGTQVAGAFQNPDGIAEACKTQKGLAALTTAANGAYLAACTGARAACTNSCGDAVKELREQIEANPSVGSADGGQLCAQYRLARAYSNQCEEYGAYIGQATGQTLANGLNYATMRACAEAAKDQNEDLAQFCAENPASPVCGDGRIDCTDSKYSSSHPDCICEDEEQRRTNPICSSTGGGDIALNGADFSSLSSNGGRGEGLLGVSELSDLLGDQTFEGQEIQGGDSSVDANQKQGSSGGPQASNGAPGGGAQRGAGAGKGPYNTDILKGAGGSKGGAASASAARGAAGSAYKYGSPTERPGAPGLDLSKFLPKAAVERGLAGMSLNAKDGLTGPMGPSIWEKVSRRYKKVRPFLKP